MLHDSDSTCPPSTTPLSNTYGTLSMSTSSTTTPDFPSGVTWNATAELFINTGNNSHLDSFLFIPLCTIPPSDMANVLLFPSVGEVQELGGDGVSLGDYYESGNEYILSNPDWADMAISGRVTAYPSGELEVDL
ncbi:hypothetical protein TeGR_g6289 [Tetraparma gracilis]|uniref:Uncharacterized protein n=1 Tax=Tetraparma gracilis TaxID=2962635 RepID=A0ABQ6MNU2_9STRA|nr:hypothetical protein TeGR_g6289 [Tetraparma gracilis]